MQAAQTPTPVELFVPGQAILEWWAPWLSTCRTLPLSYKKADRPRWYSGQVLGLGGWNPVDFSTASYSSLKRIRNPRVATLMLPYLVDEEVAEQVIHAIAQLGSGVVDPTLRGLRDVQKGDDLRVIEAHLRILGELKDARAVETLEALSKHQSERIRDAVDRALFQIRGY